MKCEECRIGIYYGEDSDYMITLKNLKKEVRWNLDMYQQDEDLFNEEPFNVLDYLDRRKNTNFFGFNYCPDCGTKINWKHLRETSQNLEYKKPGVPTVYDIFHKANNL